MQSHALLVDSTAGMIYAGTDVGVFVSSTAAPSWTEVGPVASPNTQGFLPNVAVTSLQMVNYAGTKGLRAATYGRGIWTTVPDFQLSVANNPQTIFAGQTAVYKGAVRSQNGYSNSVTLTCVSGSTAPPQACSIVPASVAPGQGFVVNASDGVADYFFNLQAVGSDPAKITHVVPLILHLVDFNLGAPSPNSITVAPGGDATVNLQVVAVGAFSGSVSLACSGLPAGASCQLQPSNTVAPTSGNPVSVTLNVSTAANTPLGTAQISINASTAGGPTKAQTFSLIVTDAPNYTLSVAVASLTAQVNSSAVFKGTGTAVNGYNSMVTLSCGSGAPPNCVASPASVNPTSAAAAFTVIASSGSAQAYPFDIDAVGSDSGTTRQVLPVLLTVLPAQSFDFTMGATPDSVSVSAGKSALYTVAVAPTTGTFPGNVSFTCSDLPALSTCSFSPTQVTSGSGNSVVALTISTTAPGPPSAASVLLVTLPLMGVFGILRR